jgi:small GTP-binding protein
MLASAKKVLKIVLAGNGGIGNTTLAKKFCYNEYAEDEGLTVGSEVFIKKYKINAKDEYLQIWDLGGQDHFRFLLQGLIYGAKGAILGFDVRRRKSYSDLKEWLGLLRKANPEMPIILVATKKDLPYHPTLNPSLGKQFVEENNLIDFTEISSKADINIELPFKMLIRCINGCKEEDPINFSDYNLAKFKPKIS